MVSTDHPGRALVERGALVGPTLRSADLRRLLSETLIAIPLGSRLPTVRELAATLGASRSLVQIVMAQLEQEGAVEIEQRGRLGATLVGRSLPILWSSAAGGLFVAALPLPSTQRSQGLATGIRAMLDEAGIEPSILYLRDPKERLQALEDGRCHLAVMSSLVADELCGPTEVVVEVLPAGSYAEEHRVYTAATPRWERLPASAREIALLAPEDLEVVGPQGEAATPYTEVRLTPEDVQATKARTLKAALVWYTANPFFEALTRGIEIECERLGITIVASVDYGSEPERMKEAVAAVMALKPDILLTISMDGTAGAEACRPAVEAGVKIVFLSSKPQGFVAGRDYVGIVTGDQYAMARGAADMLAQAIGHQGNIGMIYLDAPFYIQNLRDQIVKTVFVRNYPEITIVAEAGYSNDSDAERIARSMISAHPELNGVYVTQQEAAEGVLTALRAAQRPDVKVTSIDLGPSTLLDLVRGGNIHGLTAELTAEMGATLVREGALAMLGRRVPALTVVNALHVTRVAVDRDSVSTQQLAKLEFSDRLVQLLPVTYPQFVRLFQSGQVDMAIWDIGEEHNLLPPDTTSRPLSDRVRTEVGDRATRAAFVVRSDSPHALAVVRECLGRSELLAIQREVVAGDRLPEY